MTTPTSNDRNKIYCRDCKKFAHQRKKSRYLCTVCYRKQDSVRRKIWYHREGTKTKERRIVRSFRSRIKNMFYDNNIIKVGSVESIIGYPIRKLTDWAEKQNYNPPHDHIDHKIPVAYWIKKYPNDLNRAMRAASQLCNLRIIPARENLEKGASLEFVKKPL